MKTLHNSDVSGARQNVKDIKNEALKMSELPKFFTDEAARYSGCVLLL